MWIVEGDFGIAVTANQNCNNKTFEEDIVLRVGGGCWLICQGAV